MPLLLIAQFIDEFTATGTAKDSTVAGWDFFAGDGQIKMQFLQQSDYATIKVDAWQDRLNIWWALIKRPLTEIDLYKLVDPALELRAEARIKVSHAPRRVNLHFNHSRTIDFHSHLMEFDIPDTSNWHVISMTTQGFDARPGDIVNVQMALMDWGREQYEVDIDYFKADIVPKEMIHRDLGQKLPYHPRLADPSDFQVHLDVTQDATLDSEFSDMNFNDWVANDQTGATSLLSAGGNQLTILRWDFSRHKNRQVMSSGLLELTTYSLEKSPVYKKDFGMVRIVEIIDGDPEWDQEEVTFDSFQAGTQPLNGQMIIDDEVAQNRGQKTFFTISKPVLQRLVECKTKGLAVIGLGAVHASFYASENADSKLTPKLHFNWED